MITNVNSVFPSFALFDFKNKQKALTDLCLSFFSKTQRMFKWSGLPDTIPSRNLEQILQRGGFAVVTKHNDNLYAFSGGLGGIPNVYYEPTICTVANPALEFSKALKIDEECVLLRNDSQMLSLTPIISKYCTLLLENELSLLNTVVLSRAQFLMSASTSQTKVACDEFINKLFKGDFSAVKDENFFSDNSIGINPMQKNSDNVIGELVELEQFLKGSLFSEIGINANYNLKREALNEAEVGLNDNALFPFIDDMLEQRKIGCEKINEMYNTNITVELASVWKHNANKILGGGGDNDGKNSAEKSITDV